MDGFSLYLSIRTISSRSNDDKTVPRSIACVFAYRRKSLNTLFCFGNQCFEPFCKANSHQCKSIYNKLLKILAFVSNLAPTLTKLIFLWHFD